MEKNKITIKYEFGNKTTTTEIVDEPLTWMELLSIFKESLSGAGYVLPEGELVILDENEAVFAKKELKELTDCVTSMNGDE